MNNLLHKTSSWQGSQALPVNHCWYFWYTQRGFWKDLPVSSMEWGNFSSLLLQQLWPSPSAAGLSSGVSDASAASQSASLVFWSFLLGFEWILIFAFWIFFVPFDVFCIFPFHSRWVQKETYLLRLSCKESLPWATTCTSAAPARDCSHLNVSHTPAGDAMLLKSPSLSTESRSPESPFTVLYPLSHWSLIALIS